MITMQIIDKYIAYIRDVRRYSVRTVEIYGSVLKKYILLTFGDDVNPSDSDIVEALNPSEIRSYEVAMLDGKHPHSAKTVALHMSALSSFCRYLMKLGILKSNPVRLVPKPRVEKRLPVFYRKESMDRYLEQTGYLLEEDFLSALHESWQTESGKELYRRLLARVIISSLYSLGIRRSELLDLTVGDVDFGRNVVKVRGKGDKMREIPLIVSLSEELLLYLKAVETMHGMKRSLTEPLLVTYAGAALYPNYVDRTVKRELEGVQGIAGRKSPHVLRHTLATGLMNEGADLNSIKELLGHSSLATTQIYTHSSIARLKTIYEHAHPRAKNGGKHGD
ncbi:MAG: tyrosine-type recombinase/integrase [Bacteroidales bacterium]|nr:tyrosine-type recombinase/integrase [Bacteroidales bacterium]